MVTIKKMLILLGNGFTMDFITQLHRENEIDVQNLFNQGHCVHWPVDDEPGFLSYKQCENLWNLGARPYITRDESLNIIEDIITCANIAEGAKMGDGIPKQREDNIYIKAYKELAIYLKHLFIYYNNKITDDQIAQSVVNWGWKQFFHTLNAAASYEKVIIVTYNYDIWLERLLNVLGIKYNIGLFEPDAPDSKFTIYKPHGSISFAHKERMDKTAFRIPYSRDLSNGTISDFEVKYTNLDDGYLLNAMIPPAGDSSRIKCAWASDIRNKIIEESNTFSGTDSVIICGISYWHVDRLEIDDILTNLQQDINIKLINPNPPRALNAVLSSLFSNYINYTSSDVLGGVGPCLKS